MKCAWCGCELDKTEERLSWPAPDGGVLCQLCWEDQSAGTWWDAVSDPDAKYRSLPTFGQLLAIGVILVAAAEAVEWLCNAVKGAN